MAFINLKAAFSTGLNVQGTILSFRLPVIQVLSFVQNKTLNLDKVFEHLQAYLSILGSITTTSCINLYYPREVILPGYINKSTLTIYKECYTGD